VRARLKREMRTRRKPPITEVAINRKLKMSLAVLGLLLTVGATAAQEGGYRQPDSFYEPPAEVPAKPGALLKSEPFTGIEIPKGAQAWRIQYTTTFADGSPAVSVATVLAPVNMPDGARPVITYEHGTVGAQLRCMQSLWPAPFSRIPAAEEAIAEGWVVVATDYAFDGLDGPHPYGIGEGETRSGLDAVRAAKKMPELKLDDRTVVWGHSQGGHSALWTAILGASYAPELKILGTAAIAPVTNFARTVEMHAEKDDMPVAATIESYLVDAYSHFYPDVKFDDAVRKDAWDVAHQILDYCSAFPQEAPALGELSKKLGGTPIVPDITGGAFGERLKENNPDQKIDVPLLIAQGLKDVVVYPVLTDDYVERRCAAGQHLEYWTFAKEGHVPIVKEGSALPPALIQWTKERFAGVPQAGGCARKEFP
jgi:pimeloyl-ACP methyl ester carboxylesterase